MTNKTVWLRIALAGAFALAGLPGCSRGKTPGPEAKKARPPVPVLTATAEEADVPIEVRALGTVEPVQSSSVRSPVTGTITAVRFREGDPVREGQVLFQIDPRPFEAGVRQLQANLVRDRAQTHSAEAQTLNTEAQVRNAEAQLKNAEAQARRYEELVAKELVSREQYDQRATTLDAMRAALDAARAVAQASRSALEASRASLESTQASLENAKLQLDYTLIKAPVSGRAGSLFVDTGDLVKANDTTLVIVNQIQPILVRFTVPEPRLPAVQRYRQEKTLTIRVIPPGAGLPPREGRIVFLDNTVDRTTGTIALKAEFDNRDSALWPGQFADVSLVLATREKAVVVPTQAVQTGQQGSYVFVVEAGGTAALRPVIPGIATGGRTLLEKGLAAGEIVVTDGQLRLTPGAAVVLKAELGGPPAAGKAVGSGSGSPAPLTVKPR